MSKRVTDEERIVNFFSTAHMEKIEAISNIIRAVIRERMRQLDNGPVIAPPPAKRKRRSKQLPLQEVAS